MFGRAQWSCLLGEFSTAASAVLPYPVWGFWQYRLAVQAVGVLQLLPWFFFLHAVLAAAELNPVFAACVLTAAVLACRSCRCCSMHIQYKYVVRNKDGSVVRWQEGANVSLDLPGGNAAELALDVEDSWNKSKQVRARLAVDGTHSHAVTICLPIHCCFSDVKQAADLL